MAALFNAALGNMMGVFISPSLISVYVGSTSGQAFSYGQVFIDLSITVAGPLIIGIQSLFSIDPSFYRFNRFYSVD